MDLLSLACLSLHLLALGVGVAERSEAERERAKREFQSELFECLAWPWYVDVPSGAYLDFLLFSYVLCFPFHS